MISATWSPDVGNSQADGCTEAPAKRPAFTCQHLPGCSMSKERKWLLLLFHLPNLMGMSPIGGLKTRTLLAWGSGKCSLSGTLLSTNSQHPAQKAFAKDRETCRQKSPVRCQGDNICEFPLLSEPCHARTRYFLDGECSAHSMKQCTFIFKKSR